MTDVFVNAITPAEIVKAFTALENLSEKCSPFSQEKQSLDEAAVLLRRICNCWYHEKGRKNPREDVMKQSDLTPEQILPTPQAMEHVMFDLTRLFSVTTYIEYRDLDGSRQRLIEVSRQHNYAIPVFPETERFLQGDA